MAKDDSSMLSLHLKSSPKKEINYGFFHAMASEKSSTPSDTAEDPGTDDQATATASCVITSEEARQELAERIPPRKEAPSTSPDSSEAFLATAVPAEAECPDGLDVKLDFKLDPTFTANFEAEFAKRSDLNLDPTIMANFEALFAKMNEIM